MGRKRFLPRVSLEKDGEKLWIEIGFFFSLISID